MISDIKILIKLRILLYRFDMDRRFDIHKNLNLEIDVIDEKEMKFCFDTNIAFSDKKTLVVVRDSIYGL